MVKLKGTTAVVMTSDGRFLRVKVKGRFPAVGEQYCGEVLESSKIYIRYLAAAAAVVLLIFSFSVFKLYYTAYASVVVDINPSIEIVINRWERIIKSIPLNKDGDKILSRLQLANLSLSDGLKMIVDESIKQNFIKTDQSTIDQKSVEVNINYVRAGKEVNLKDFEEYITRASIKYDIKQQSAVEGRRIEDGNKRIKDENKEKQTENNNGQTDKKIDKNENKKTDKNQKGSEKVKDNVEGAIDRNLNGETANDKNLSGENKNQGKSAVDKANNGNKQDSYDNIEKNKREDLRGQYNNSQYNNNREENCIGNYKGFNYGKDKNIPIKDKNKN